MNATLSLVSPTYFRGRHTGEHLAQRLVLYANELYRVPPTFRMIRVTSGRAHVTHAGKDLILSRGQEAMLDASKDVALVSPLECDQVVVELYDE